MARKLLATSVHTFAIFIADSVGYRKYTHVYIDDSYADLVRLDGIAKCNSVHFHFIWFSFWYHCVLLSCPQVSVTYRNMSEHFIAFDFIFYMCICALYCPHNYTYIYVYRYP